MAASISAHRPAIHTRKEATKSTLKKGKGKENVLKPPNPAVTGSFVESPWDHDIPWNWTSFTDPSSSRIPPIFTKDGSYFFSLTGSSVKVYSAVTGLVVSTLSAPPSSEQTDRSDVLTSAIINPQNSFQLVAGTLDGRILIWDFVNATLLQTINLGQPIHFMCAHERFKGSVFVAASRPNRKADPNDNNAVVLKISLKQSEHTSRPADIQSVGRTRFPTGLSISSNGAWLVATAAHKVYVARTENPSAGFTKYVSSDRLTCLAFHPFEEYFATGDEKGVVRLWYCLNDNLAVNVRGVEKRTQTRPFHWHAHAVSSITFTPNGAYLLSGGEESVLVIWQLHTGKKEFVPRVGAPISTVSVSKSSNGEEEYLLGLTDATYTFVSSSSLKITRSYSRLKVEPSTSSSSSKLTTVPLAMQPTTSILVLQSSHPSSLQMYSPSSSTLVSELEVSPSNRVSRRDDKPIIPSQVERVAISSCGLWMATIDRREADIGFRPDVYLKIWSWSSKDENWILNTRVDRPHGTAKITDLCYNPVGKRYGLAVLVSTGEDGQIKVWELRKPSGLETEIWACQATLSFRSEIPRAVSWAPDSSLFAVSVGSHVAIYDPVTASLRQTLTAPYNQTMCSAHFVGPLGRYVVASAQSSIILWDLIDSQVVWQSVTPLQIDKVVPHPRDPTFIVIHSPISKNEEHETKISVFQISSSVPSSVYSVPFSLRGLIVDSSQSHGSGFNLIGVTYAWRVVGFGDATPPLKDIGGTPRDLNRDHRPQKRTLFQDIFGASAFAHDLVDLPEPGSVQRKDTQNHAMFTVPAFIAPSIDTLFDPIVKSFLKERPMEHKIDTDLDNVDEDAPMDEDEDLSLSPDHLPRAPYPGELEAFTKLFRTHCRTGTILPVAKANKKPNGVPTDINGTVRHSSTTPKAIPVNQALAQNRLDEVMDKQTIGASVSGPSGKKRKKSSS